MQILAEHSGTDITDLFSGEDPQGHAHSTATLYLLEQFYLGTLTTQKTKLLPLPQQKQKQQKQHPFPIDESKPLLWQVGSLGTQYMDWVESPVPGHPRFFKNNLAEAVTKTPWWVVPLLWLPLVAHQIFYKASFSTSDDSNSRNEVLLSSTSVLLFVLLGIVIWQGIEYSLHRFVFHLHPTTPCGIFLHFLVHGCHHKYPMDVERLVFPPIPASWIVAIVYSIVYLFAPDPATAAAVFGGIMLGYVSYDCMHYWMHSGVLHGPLKVAHMRHHYVDSSRGYGISSPLFDFLLGTMAPVK